MFAFFFIILCHCGRKPKSNEAFATSSCDSDFSLNFDCCACDQKENICDLTLVWVYFLKSKLRET